MRKICAFFLILAVGAFAAGIEKIKERGYLSIAAYSDRPPFGYVDKKGEFKGFDILIGKALAKELLGGEDKVKFVEVNNSDRADSLSSGEVDIVLASYSITRERRQFVDFADPYMKSSIGVVSPAKKPVKNLPSLRDKRLLAIKGTVASIYFLKNYPEMNQVFFIKSSDAYAALLKGEGDALADDTVKLIHWANTNRDYVVSMHNLGDIIPIAPAVAKGDRELLEWINKTLEKLKKDGVILDAYNKELRRHYGKDADPYLIIY